MLGIGEPTRWVGNTELDWFMTNSPLLFGNPIPLKEFHISDHIAISNVLYCIVLCCILLYVCAFMYICTIKCIHTYTNRFDIDIVPVWVSSLLIAIQLCTHMCMCMRMCMSMSM